MFTRSCCCAMFVGALSVLAALTGASRAAPATQPATAPAAASAAVDDATLAQALAAAKAAGQANPAFRTGLQSVAAGFQPVEVTAAVGEAKWNRVTLNRLGKGVDAIRFRTPPAGGKPADLKWVFAHPPGSLDGWYILPVRGEMKGFTDFTKLKSAKFDGAGIPGDYSAIAQRLNAASLQPDTDYLIWFTFKGEQPAELHLAINVSPRTGSAALNDVLKSLGLNTPK